MSVAGVRREYRGQPLTEATAAADPFDQFALWFEQARAVEADPTAMTLATATAAGRPSARMVLLKGFDARGFVFYTNYDSRKAEEIEATHHAALLFYWPSLDRQVRIEGASRASRAPSRTPTSRRGRSRADGARTPRRKAARSTVASRSKPPSRWRASCSGRLYRAPRGGAASASHRTRSSSGKGVRTAFTTGSPTHATRDPGVAKGSHLRQRWQRKQRGRRREGFPLSAISAFSALSASRSVNVGASATWCRRVRHARHSVRGRCK